MTLAYTLDTSTDLEDRVIRYARNNRAQNVSFRKLVHWLKVGERATHYLHPYPAKLLPQIAHYFLAAKSLTPPRGVVLDPFGGTGTVALEALLSGRQAYYADVNPLARMIARVKTRPPAESSAKASLARVRKRYNERLLKAPPPDVVNIRHWYASSTIKNLSDLLACVRQERNEVVRSLLELTFSSVARRLSNADPRLSVPVRLGEDVVSHTRRDVWNAFESQLLANIKRISELERIRPASYKHAICAGSDARKLTSDGRRRLRKNSIDLVLTSPPYSGAQKYIRASSLNLGWLGLAASTQLKDLDKVSIGREHHPRSSLQVMPVTGIAAADRVIKRVWKIDRTRAVICAVYLEEMRDAITEVARVLKAGGHFVLVIGNNEVCGINFKSSEYLAEICHNAGLKIKLRLVDEIKSRGLMTKRNKSAGVISREWVLLFEKTEL